MSIPGASRARRVSAGLLGALVISARDDRRQTIIRHQLERADVLAAPVRSALAGLDVAALALDATRRALDAAPWLGVRDIAMADAGPARNTGRAVIDGPRSVLIEYQYYPSPDFTQIRVVATVSVDPGAGGGAKPDRLRTIQGITQLRTRSYDAAENAAQWSADGGRRTRLAVSDGFAQVAVLMPQALKLDERDIAAMTDRARARAFGGGYYGPLIASDQGTDRITLWSGGPVSVRTVP